MEPITYNRLWNHHLCPYTEYILKSKRIDFRAPLTLETFKEELLEKYDEVRKSFHRKMLNDTKIDRYKIAAAISVAILRNPPFKIEQGNKTSEEERRANEILAYSAGVYILATFKIDDEECFNRTNEFDLSTVLDFPDFGLEHSFRDLILKGMYIDRQEQQLGCILLHNFYILLAQYIVV